MKKNYVLHSLLLPVAIVIAFRLYERFAIIMGFSSETLREFAAVSPAQGVAAFCVGLSIFLLVITSANE